MCPYHVQIDSLFLYNKGLVIKRSKQKVLEFEVSDTRSNIPSMYMS